MNERPSHGEAAWFIRDKRLFAMFADHHHDDRVAVWCAATPEARGVLMMETPDRYFVPPYVGARGWIGVWLDVEGFEADLEDILSEAHALIASKRR